MDETTVFIRTDRGREEIRARTRKLTAALRSLLIEVDGVRDAASVTREFPSASRFKMLQELLRLDLIEHQHTTRATAAITATENFDRFRQATQFLNEATALLGMTGYFFSLKIQRCGSLDDLRNLAPDFRSAVAQQRGDRDADELMRRFNDAVG